MKNIKLFIAFFLLISLNSCTSISTPVIDIHKPVVVASNKAIRDDCNSQNLGRKTVDRYSTCFEKYPKFQSRLPDCDKMQHPLTWNNCFGVLENPKFPGMSIEGEFESGSPKRGVINKGGNSYKGEIHNMAPSGVGVYVGTVDSFRALWESGKIKEVYLANFSQGSHIDNIWLRQINWDSFFYGEFALLIPAPSQFPCPGHEPKNWTFCKKEILFDDGEKYIGLWEDGLYHQEGTYFYKDGSFYKGGWKKGKKHGQGFLYSSSSKFVEQYWFEGSLKTKDEFSKLEENKPIYSKRDMAVSNNKKLALDVVLMGPRPDGAVNIEIKTGVHIVSLQINGEEHGEKLDGVYSLRKLALAGQDTKFDIIAKDILGNTATKTVSVQRPLATASVNNEKLDPTKVPMRLRNDSVAIIIGISNYKNLPRADYADLDAIIFYDYATRALGVKPENIKLLVDMDADQAEIYRAFKTWLPSKVRPTTDVYVFYSGHGLPTADGQGLYLLPQRADRDFIDKTAITQSEINVAIQAAKPNSTIIFLDACYSGEARTGEVLLTGARPVSLKSGKAIFPSSFTVFSASQSDQISSSSPDLKHGIFSYYLMKGMEGDADINRDGKITLGEMQGYLSENVGRQAGMMNRKQEPQLIGDPSKVLVGR
jgi:hypothetical protein